MKKFNMKTLRQKGFTLIEILSALALFSIAMLGIAFNAGSALKTSANDNVRGIALYTTTIVVEQFFYKSGQGADQIRAAIIAFDSDTYIPGVSQEVLGNNGKDVYIITLTGGVDNNGVNIITDNNPATWVSPVTIAVNVVYRDDPSISEMASYTFVF